MFAPVMYVFGESVEVFAAKSLALAYPPFPYPPAKFAKTPMNRNTGV